MHKYNQNIHKPVLLSEVLEYLSPKPEESYLDLTAGYGGHASRIVELTKAPNKAYLVDRDQQAVDHLSEAFAGLGANIIHSDFLAASKVLAGRGIKFDMILADLGISSLHIDNPERGFSLKQRAGLDMRMDTRQKLTAEEIVNNWSEDKLSFILQTYGEEKSYKTIVKAIIASRPIVYTDQLAQIVASVKIRSKRSKIHPATKVFQALRIAVNDELGQLERALPVWIGMLEPGGRLAIISFHSLEDRLVKQMFANESGNRYDAQLKLLTKNLVSPAQNEIVHNPRSRSAKLRVAVKIKIKERGD